MSADAEARVQAFVHPEVKGSARRLLEVIAQQIPEADTMTPEITIPELSTLMGYGDNAARRARRDLVKVRVVRIVGGGQGQVSRYELMLLPNAQGYDPALPLIGATPPPAAPRVRRPRPSIGPTLFDEASEVRASDIVQKDRSWGRHFDPFVRSTWVIVGVLRTFCTMLRFNFVHFVRSAAPLDVDDARARDVHTFTNVQTHTPGAPPAEPTEHSPPPVIVHPWHAWCGRVVCVPQQLHDDWQRKGHEAAWLFAFYVRRHAAISPGEKITGNEFTWWRAALKAELAASTPARASPNSHDEFSRRELEDAATYRRMRFGHCPHEPRHLHEAECIRDIAWWRRTEGSRKQG